MGEPTSHELTSLYPAALAAHKAGLCVVPPAEDGSKAPLASWKRYQAARPTRDQLDQWYRVDQRSGLGYVCGAVSGGLEMLEFEDHATYDVFRDTAAACGLGLLVDRLEAGYLEMTPGGGTHWLYRCDEIAGNTRLAMRPKSPEEQRDPHDRYAILIETRGEGGYAIAAPSNGRVHPSGRPYRLLRGGPATIITITPDERRALWELARTFDQRPRRPISEPSSPSSALDGTRPGDVFNHHADWATILQPHGWQRVYERDGVTYWRRPGKEHGISATTGYAGTSYLYVFSTSTIFEPERGYSPFAAYTLVEHAGDYHAAAKALAAEGYGRADERRRGAAEVRLHGRDAVQQGNGMTPVPPFPVEVFPPEIQAYVTECAAAIGVPPDLVAVPLLGMAGATIGRSRRIVLKDGYEQRPILYLATVAPPGSAKSPAQDAARYPVDELQREAYETYKFLRDAYEREIDEWKRADLTDRGPKPQKPILAHFYTTDATLEALAPMTQHAPGVAIVRDELVSWVKSHDMYRGGKGGDRQGYLSLWAGAPLKVDRKNGEPLFVPDPTICVIGGIQPDLLPELNDESQRRDGFIERILWTFPDVAPAHWSEASVSDARRAEIVTLFRQLRRTFEPPDTGITLLHPEARSLWADWYNENQLLVGSANGVVQGIYAKLPNQVARLALVLHCLWNLDDPARMVSLERLADAIELGEYFRAHAHRVVPYFGGGGPALSGGLALRIRRILERAARVEGADGWMGRTELHRKLGNTVRADDLTDALATLEAAGQATHRRQGSGTKPADQWRHVPRMNEEYEQSAGSAVNPGGRAACSV